MLNKIEALIDDLKWEIKDREINYIPAVDLENIVRKLKEIVSHEREENIELIRGFNSQNEDDTQSKC